MFKPQDPRGGKRKLTPESCPLIAPPAWHTCSGTNRPTHTIKCKNAKRNKEPLVMPRKGKQRRGKLPQTPQSVVCPAGLLHLSMGWSAMLTQSPGAHNVPIVRQQPQVGKPGSVRAALLTGSGHHTIPPQPVLSLRTKKLTSVTQDCNASWPV